MADFFVDNILNNNKIEGGWIKTTSELIKINGFKYMLDLFCSASEESNIPGKNKKSIIKSKYSGNLNITDIADKFGLKPLGRSSRICPFHADKDPSLSLSNELGVFHCFGCGAKGNIVKFYAMLKKVSGNGNR